MRTYTVIFRKPSIYAKATIRFVNASWPDEVQWQGERSAFRLSDGSMVAMLCTMDRVAATAAHQAAQAGATFTVTHDGGEAAMRVDHVLPGD
jgi:hypothetical protein